MAVGTSGASVVERRRPFLQHLVHRRRERVGLERFAAAQQLVEEHAGREDVRPVIDRLGTDLLGRHVVHRADDHVAAGQLGGDEPREPEVEDAHAARVG